MSADYKSPAAGQKLEMYVSPECPYCAEARAYYDAEKIAYVVHDAQNDLAERKWMFAYTGGDPTVPAIVIDGTYIRSGWGEPPHG